MTLPGVHIGASLLKVIPLSIIVINIIASSFFGVFAGQQPELVIEGDGEGEVRGETKVGGGVEKFKIESDI